MSPNDNSNSSDDLQYRIGDVAAKFKVENHVLRYWEKDFDKLKPRKTNSGQRSYSKTDIEIISIIKYLLYDQHYTNLGANELLNRIVDDGLSLEQVQDRFNNFCNPESDDLREQLHLTQKTLEDSHAKNEALINEINELRAQLEASSEVISQNQILRSDAESWKMERADLVHEIERQRNTVAQLQGELKKAQFPDADLELTLASLKASLRNTREDLQSVVSWVSEFKSPL